MPKQTEIVNKRRFSLWLVLIATLLFQSSNAGANDAVCKLSAFFVLPPGKAELSPSESGLLAIKFSNDTDFALQLDSLKPKGVEQLSEAPVPTRQAGVLPCYLGTLLVEFIDEKGRTIHQDTPTLTVSGILKPGEQVTCLVTTLLPSFAGTFKVKLSKLTSAQNGQFAFDPALPKNREPHISDLGNLSVEIEGVRISNTRIKEAPKK